MTRNMESTTYEIHPIPYPPSPKQVHKYASLRLLALGTNPECFSSTHAREQAFTEEEWRERIDNSKRVTFVAVASPRSQEDSASTQPPCASSATRPLLDDDAYPWVGLVTVLTPEFCKSVGSAIPESLQLAPLSDIYILVSMWVHPEHRRRRLGSRLMSQAMDWVHAKSSDRAIDSASLDNQGKEKYLLLEVSRSNHDAVDLYKRMGFKEIGDDGLSEAWMALTLY